MSFWEDLSPNVKRYLIFALVMIGALLAFRKCTGPSTAGEPAPRGLRSN
jgi:hypothetical protein